jgi:hypothetical protein
MKQLLINRLESILVAVGGAVPAPLVPSNFYARSLQLAELILVAIGGTVPPAVTPTNYKQRLLILLELSLIAEGQTPIPLTPIASFRDRLLTLLGQLLVFGGGSVPALATPTNFEQRLLLLMDGLVVAAPNFVSSFQAETVAYENRVIALGSTLPAGAKTAIDAFFAAIKGQSYYSKIKMLWLACGPLSVAGLATHLIHVTNGNAVLTGFAPEHYTSSGANAGLQGASTGRRVTHSLSPTELGTNDVCAFCFTSTLTLTARAVVCVGGATSTDLIALFPNYSNSAFWEAYSDLSGFLSVVATTIYGSATSGFLLGTRSGTSGALYFNGALAASGPMTSGTQPNTGNTHSFYAPFMDPNTFPGKIQLTGCGLAMTAPEVAHFSTQVATLIAALRA